MPSADPFGALTARQRASSGGRTGPLWIAGILVALSSVVLVWVLRSEPPVPVVVQRLPPSEPAAPPPAEAPEVERPAPAPVPPKTAPRKEARTPAPVIAVVTAPAVLPESPVLRREPTRDVTPRAPAAPAAPARPAVAAAPPGLYSASDADVTPPQPVQQRWFNVLPAGVRPDEVVTIDFIVDEQGLVSSAKVRGEPRSVGESMLFSMSLQALKSWQFLPAVKGGNPVRYRQTRSFGVTAVQPPQDPPQER